MFQKIAVLFLLALPLAAEEISVEFDPARTRIAFSVGATLHTVRGTFKLKRGVIHFDPSSGKANGEIAVDVNSGVSGEDARDNRMRKEILEVMRFPDAIFTPDRVTGTLAPEGSSQLDVHGIFQLHGTPHEVTWHFSVESKPSLLTAATQFTVPYVEWGIKNASNFLLKVKDKVDVSITASGRITR